MCDPASREFSSAALSLEHHAGRLQSYVVSIILCLLCNKTKIHVKKKKTSIFHLELYFRECNYYSRLHLSSSLDFSLKFFIKNKLITIKPKGLVQGEGDS